MRNALSKGYSGLAFLALALGVLQFFLAGLGIFGASSFDAHEGVGYLFHTIAVIVFLLALAGLGIFGASSFDAHEGVGYLFHTIAVVVFLLALAGPRTGRDIGMGALFAVLATVQIYLPELRGDVPELAAVHPLLALFLLGLAAHIGRRYIGSGARGSGATAPA
jgi:hypothetical protein